MLDMLVDATCEYNSIELEECLMLRADNACAIDMHFTKETIYD